MKSEKPSSEDLGLSIIETLSSSDLPSITQDLTEVALDSVLQDGTLRDIPVIGTIVGLTRIAIAVRDKLLVRKIIDFLKAVDITEEERIKFLNDLADNQNYRRRIGENLILDLLHKCAIMGR